MSERAVSVNKKDIEQYIVKRSVINDEKWMRNIVLAIVYIILKQHHHYSINNNMIY